MGFVSLQNGLNPGLSGFSIVGTPGMAGIQVMSSPGLQQLPLQADFAALLQSLTSPRESPPVATSQPASQGLARLKAVLKQHITEGKLQIVTPSVEGQTAESDNRQRIEVADGGTNPEPQPVAWLILPSLKGPVEASIESGQETLLAPVALLVEPQSKSQDLEEAFHDGVALPIRLVFLSEPLQVDKSSLGRVGEPSKALPTGAPFLGSGWVEVPSETLKSSLKPSVTPPQIIQASLVGKFRPVESEIPQRIAITLPLPFAASMSQPPLIQIHLPEEWRETLLPRVPNSDIPESANAIQKLASQETAFLPEALVRDGVQTLMEDTPKIRLLLGEIVGQLRDLGGEITAIQVNKNLPGNSRPGAIPQGQAIQSQPEILQFSFGAGYADPLYTDSPRHQGMTPAPGSVPAPSPAVINTLGDIPLQRADSLASPLPQPARVVGPAPLERAVSAITLPPVDLETAAPAPALEVPDGVKSTIPAVVAPNTSKLVGMDVLPTKSSRTQSTPDPVSAAQNPSPTFANPELKLSCADGSEAEEPADEVSNTQDLPEDGGTLPELAPNEVDVPEGSETINPRPTILNPAFDRGTPRAESPSQAPAPAAQVMTHTQVVSSRAEKPMSPAVHQAEESAILDQLAKGIQVRQTPSNSEIRIRLIPESLGELHIKISLKADVLVAEIRAATGAAHEVLSKHTFEIQNILQNAGLQTDQVLVRMAAPPTQGGWNGDANQRDSSTSWPSSRNNPAPRDQGNEDQQQPSRNPSRRNPWDGWDEYA